MGCDVEAAEGGVDFSERFEPNMEEIPRMIESDEGDVVGMVKEGS